MVYIYWFWFSSCLNFHSYNWGGFHFLVGDGIRNVTLHSPKHLNDNEWHYVEAEINVKLARLKVDFLPPAIHKFPGQTYITMKFTQPLLVGKNYRAGVLSRIDMKHCSPCIFIQERPITP